MNGQRILISVLVLVLTLTLVVGLSRAEGPVSSPYQGEGRVGAGLAPLGKAFTYQGQLKLSGVLVNGTCDFRFILYTADVGGSQVGPIITLEAVAVSNGLFTVQLDFGASAFTGDARWLEIAVRYPAGSGSYTILNPRQALTPAPYALALPGLWTQQNATSPNLIGGYSGNSVTLGVVGATISGGGASGSANSVTANYGTVSGGYGNTASGVLATIGGGEYISVTGQAATVAGGSWITVTDNYGAVGGGSNNQAGNANTNLTDATHATVGGGRNNTASAWYATIGGGRNNTASGWYTTVSGGASNTASGSYAATVGGGANNTASNDYATIGGGEYISVTGQAATVAGGSWNTATLDYGTVGGGIANTASGYAATVGGGYQNTAIYTYTTVSGGVGNTASGVGAFVGGGGWNGVDPIHGNQALGRASTIGGGVGNTASGWAATVGGGWQNIASGGEATVGGGSDNIASGDIATVGGGLGNKASYQSATVGGGTINEASGLGATVPGGYWNRAYGEDSFAAGCRAKANHKGAFVWADSYPFCGVQDAFDFSSTAANQFSVRATGGARFVLAIDGSGNPTWTCSIANGGSWSCTSDRNLKENLVAVDGRQTLERLSRLPVFAWNAQGQDPSIRHLGPMAQDFYAAFGLGEDERQIATIDLDGVALAAIQGLYQNYQDLQADNATLKAENAALHQQVTTLEQRLTAIEERMSSGSASAGPTATNLFSGRWGTLGLVLAGLAVGLLATRRGGGR